MPYPVNGMDVNLQAQTLQDIANARNNYSSAITQQAIDRIGGGAGGSVGLSGGGGVGGGGIPGAGTPANFRTIADMVSGYTQRNSPEGMGTSGIEGRLAALLDDPESIRETAAYKFREGQGREALQRSMGAKGMLGSGNRLTELTKYGQDMASQEYDNQFGRLSGLLGNYMNSDDRRLAGMLGTAQNIYATDVGASMDKYRTDVGANTSIYGYNTGANTAAGSQGIERDRLASEERNRNLSNIYNWSNYQDPLDVGRLY